MSKINHTKLSKQRLKKERELTKKLLEYKKKQLQKERKRLALDLTKRLHEIELETQGMTEIEKIQFILKKKQ